MKQGLVTLILCFLFMPLFAQNKYDFNENCKAAYNEILKLKLDSGEKLIAAEKKQNPANLIPYLLESYIDFFELFFNEDPLEYQARKPNFEKRITLFDSGPANDPFYRYCKALSYIQRACIKIKFGERYSAGWDFKKANSLVKENLSKYPAFQPNKLVFGPIEVVIGTVPQGYKWITSLFGMKGSISDGMLQMRSFINSNDRYAKLMRNEALFYYCYLMFYIENNPAEVFKLISSARLDVVNNHLFTYLAANLAINSKQNDYAENVLHSRNRSVEYMKTEAWNFELGYVKLHKLQADSSLYYFDKFISNFRGRFYVKDVLQKMSWAYYLKGDTQKAELYRLLILKKGSTDSDADKKAYRDARKATWPQTDLLKARILNDGGYQTAALAALKGKSDSSFASSEDRLEFNYRLARIYDDLKNDEKAIKFYQRAIALGTNMPEYYAARAALQIAFIYEKRNDKAAAIKYFQLCLDMKDHEFKDSLDQRAKSGIARCNGE